MKADLHLQSELVDVFQDIARTWFERSTSKAELALQLPNKLTAARSVPDALSAYQEWLGEWMSVWGEDARCVFSDSQKLMDTGARYFANAAPAMTS